MALEFFISCGSFPVKTMLWNPWLSCASVHCTNLYGLLESPSLEAKEFQVLLIFFCKAAAAGSILVMSSELIVHLRRNKKCRHWHSDWDQGPFAAMLQCLHLDKTLFQQQSTKKLKGTRNNCKCSWDNFWAHVHPWLIHVNIWQKPLQYCKVISFQNKLIKFFKKDQKPQLLLLKSQEQKPRVRSKSRVLGMPPAHNIT